jgi:hypothetical protein
MCNIHLVALCAFMTFTQFLARVRPPVTRNNFSHFIRFLCHRSCSFAKTSRSGNTKWRSLFYRVPHRCSGSTVDSVGKRLPDACLGIINRGRRWRWGGDKTPLSQSPKTNVYPCTRMGTEEPFHWASKPSPLIKKTYLNELSWYSSG